ncbi:MAG: hypothetical protein AAB766_00550 [Patescibacteria group bacterium]
MENKNPESKYLMLWIAVIISAIIIIVGWFYAIKYNMAKISEDMGKSGQTEEQAVKEFNDMVAGIGEIMKKQEVAPVTEVINGVKPEAVVDNKTAEQGVTETPEKIK